MKMCWGEIIFLIGKKLRNEKAFIKLFAFRFVSFSSLYMSNSNTHLIHCHTLWTAHPNWLIITLLKSPFVLYKAQTLQGKRWLNLGFVLPELRTWPDLSEPVTWLAKENINLEQMIWVTCLAHTVLEYDMVLSALSQVWAAKIVNMSHLRPPSVWNRHFWRVSKRKRKQDKESTPVNPLTSITVMSDWGWPVTWHRW